jgi:hypothetical protein
VINNEVVFRLDDVWDFEYAHNHAVARYGPRDIALRMDFRGYEAKIEGKIWLGQHQITLSPEIMTLPRGNRMIGCQFSAPVGIQIGEGGPAAVRVEE